MRIIGVAGKAGAGKDTVGALIGDSFRYSHPYVKRNFADALKEYCRAKYGLTWDQVYTGTGKSTLDPYWGVTPRQILQFEGTEATRNIVGKLIPSVNNDFWIRRLELHIDQEDFVECDYAIICDVRFQNEADWILSQNGGILINVLRPGAEAVSGIANHQSEEGFTVLPGERNYHEITNDGTIEELKVKINSLMKEIL